MFGDLNALRIIYQISKMKNLKKVAQFHNINTNDIIEIIKSFENKIGQKIFTSIEDGKINENSKNIYLLSKHANSLYKSNEIGHKNLKLFSSNAIITLFLINKIETFSEKFSKIYFTQKDSCDVVFTSKKEPNSNLIGYIELIAISTDNINKNLIKYSTNCNFLQVCFNALANELTPQKEIIIEDFSFLLNEDKKFQFYTIIPKLLMKNNEFYQLNINLPAMPVFMILKNDKISNLLF